MKSASVNITALMCALLAACIAFQLNATMLSPVLYSIASGLNVDIGTVGLTQTAFFTSAALFSIFVPRLSDIVGRKKILLGMLILMSLGSVLAAISSNIGMLFVARIIQGISGPIVPLCLLLLHHEVKEPKKYGMLMGIVTAVNGGIAGIDVYLGGYMTTRYGFHSVFWLMAITGCIAAIIVQFGTRESRPSAGTRMDWTGVLLLVSTLAGLLFALNEAGKVTQANWLFVILCAGIAMVSFFLFLKTEKKVNNPLVAIHHLKLRSTWALLLTTLLTMTGIFAIINGLVINLAQDPIAGFKFGADYASLILLTPYALVGWLVGPFTGRLAPTLGYTKVLRLGLIGSIIAIAIMMFFGINSLTILVITTLIIGITYAGTANIMLNGMGVLLSPEENPGFLPGMNAAAFHLGAGLSFALLMAIQTLTGSPETTTGYFNGMFLGLVITVGALLTSLLIPKSKIG